MSGTALTPGLATAQGTAAYVDGRIARVRVSPEHFHKLALGGETLYFSSVGLGTYLGRYDETTDAGYAASVMASLEAGVNVIDTASNYRHQRSELAVGVGLQRAASQGFLRDQVIVSSKAGFIPFDKSLPEHPRRWIEEHYIRPGLIPAAEIVEGCHALSPAFIDHQFERSLENLGLAAIDIYYLHNIEMQRAAVGAQEFRRRVRAAVEVLERKAADGRLRAWGVATWDGLRVRAGDPNHLELSMVRDLAREVAGDGHHFGAIQLPYNLAMTEAFVLGNQNPEGRGPCTVLETAAQYGLAVYASASILQGRLVRGLQPEIGRAFPECANDAQRALQFVRSTPGITSALCGMSRVAHVHENLRVAQSAPKGAALRALYMGTV